MKLKIAIGYMISSIVFACLVYLLSFFLKDIINGLNLSKDLNEYIKALLYFTCAGLVIGILAGIIKIVSTNSFFELLICLFVSATFLFFCSLNLKSSFEGVSIWFIGFGVVMGIVIFLINRIVQRFI